MYRESYPSSSELKTALVAAPAIIVTGLGVAAFIGAVKAAEAITAGVDAIRHSESRFQKQDIPELLEKDPALAEAYLAEDQSEDIVPRHVGGLAVFRDISPVFPDQETTYTHPPMFSSINNQIPGERR